VNSACRAIHGPGRLGPTRSQPRCDQSAERPASGRPSRKPMQARRDAAARMLPPSMAPAGLGRRGRSQGATSRPSGRRPAGRRVSRCRPEGMQRRECFHHPWPRQAWPGVVAAKVRPAGRRTPSRRPWPPRDGGALGGLTRRRVAEPGHAARPAAAACPAVSRNRRRRRGCPCPRSRRRWPAQPRRAKRRHLRVSGGQDARSERPAMGHGQPRPETERRGFHPGMENMACRFQAERQNKGLESRSLP
jgi:hypothetical protein